MFVQNLAPGAAARAGFGAKALRDENPRLIVCDITGYGESGPYAEMKAYDLLIQCETGLASITGRAGVAWPRRRLRLRHRLRHERPRGDPAGALRSRAHRRGRPDSVSLFDAWRTGWRCRCSTANIRAASPSASASIMRASRPTAPMRRATERRSSSRFQTSAEWASLCRLVLARPDMIDDPRFSTNSRRTANRAALDEEMGKALSRFDAAQMAEALRSANIAFGRYNTVGEFARHVQLRRAEVGTPSGPVSVPAPPQIFDRDRSRSGPLPRSANKAKGSAANSRASG